MALAIDPGAFEAEAINALRMARELVKNDRSLAHLAPAPVAPAPTPAPPDEDSYEVRITNLPPSWLLNVLTNVSEQAYGLGAQEQGGV